LGDSGLLFTFLSSCHILLYQLIAIKDRLFLETNSQKGKWEDNYLNPRKCWLFLLTGNLKSPPRSGTKRYAKVWMRSGKQSDQSKNEFPVQVEIGKDFAL
jgi:hypothetical protein